MRTRGWKLNGHGGQGIGDRIAGDLRRQIHRGELAPGARLPSNPVLRQHYRVTSVTVCRAVKQLCADGYLRSARRSGVFVSDQPPHQHRFGIVFHSHPADALNWWRLGDVVYSEAGKGIPGLDCQFTCYLNIRPDSNRETLAPLAADIAAHRIGGLLFTADPWQLYGVPCLQAPPMPRAAIMHAGRRSDMDAVQFAPMLDRALEWLATQGRRRVAFIWSSTLAQDDSLGSYAQQQATRYGMGTRPEWHQFGDIVRPASAAAVVRLLLAAPAGQRPDALVVTDDNLTGAVEKGILAAGARVPDDLLVVSHCNFPQPAYTCLPFRRLGYDIRALLRDTVLRFRAGGAAHGAGVILVPPIWEDEFRARWSTPADSAAAG